MSTRSGQSRDDPHHAVRVAAFAHLVANVQSCDRCPRMAGRTRVLSAANGPVRPLVCFIAEAPGRRGHGQALARLPGDQTSRNFAALLAAAGLTREEIFTTNAVLCNPRDAQGRNAPPTRVELANCAPHLAATLALLQPSVVVTLGAVALRAITTVAPHPLTLAADVGRLVAWDGRWLMPLYHPSPRAQLSRPFARQRDDFTALGRLVRAVTSPDRDGEPT